MLNRLFESEESYRTLVSQVKDYAIFRADLSGRATSWNEGVGRVLGFSESEFIGRNISTIFIPEDILAGIPQRELKTARSEGTANNDRWLKRKDGTRFFASGITTALRDKAGKVIGFTKVLRDQTEKKQWEERLERTVAERTLDLREANEQLETLVNSLAHDLRGPLRSITGYCQLLLDEQSAHLGEDAREMLRRIEAISQSTNTMLNDLLAYGRTASAEVKLGPVELKGAWTKALLQCAIQIEESHARIETLEPLPRVWANEAILGQVLVNLLSNALKFVAPKVEPRIRFYAEEHPPMVRLWIEDNGIGIPKNQQEHIFRVFERLHQTDYAGTGIGLSIVRKGVERMCGRIGVESEPGKGSRFWIELPISQA